MLERIYDTFIGILFSEFPKNAKNQAIIYDRPISGFYVGDIGIKPNSISISIKGGNSPLKDIALGLQEFDHNLTVLVNVGADDIQTTERLTQEASRIILSILRKHRKIWVVDLCPICGKSALSPVHFTNDHSSLLSTYQTTVTNEFNTLWAETHPVSVPAPSIPTSGLAAESFIRLYNDVVANVNVPGLSTDARNNILRMYSDNLDPVRLLYNVTCSDAKPSDDSINGQLFRNGSITINAKELIRQTQYGPDNVSTSAYSR